MDKEGNSLETLAFTKRQEGRPVSADWPSHLDRSATILREVANMMPLPGNTKRLHYIANDLELLASQLRHPSSG